MSDTPFPPHYTQLDKLYALQLSTLTSITESYDHKTNTTPDGITISMLLKSLVHNFGVSSRDIAKLANCSSSTVLNYIAGKMPDHRFAKEIRKDIKVAILQILSERAKKLPPFKPEF
jgi:hypothetical protein